MNIKYALQNFIQSKEPQIISLKGRWGVGKTYLWNNYLISIHKKINCEQYAYISLFGINSLDQLKYDIFQNTIPTSSLSTGYYKTQGKDRFTNIKEEVSKTGWWKTIINNIKILGNLKETLGNFTIGFEKIAFSFVSNTLICFDDIERKGDDLNIREIFGLANFLKEQRNCKILFIVNDDQLDQIKNDFDRFKEKTVDRELRLTRVPAESYNLIYPHSHDSIISDSIEKLKIDNLRIIKRIHSFLNQLSELIDESELEAEAVNELKKTVILFTWMNFDSSEEVPTIEFLMSRGNNPFDIDLGGRVEVELSEEQKEIKVREEKWVEILNSYRFISFNELDEIIWNFISQGTLDKELFEKKIQERNDVYFKQGVSKLYDEAWNLYHNSFGDNLEEFIEKLTEAVKKNLEVKSINVSNLSATLDILSDFKRDQEYEEIKDLFIDTINDYTQDQLQEMLRYPFRELNKDIEAIIKTELEKEERPYSFQELVDQLAYKNSWGGDVKTALANKTEEDYFNFFSNVISDDLDEYIKVCLRFGEFANADEEGILIADKTKKALIRIGSTNQLNRMRIQKKYKLNIPDYS